MRHRLSVSQALLHDRIHSGKKTDSSMMSADKSLEECDAIKLKYEHTSSRASDNSILFCPLTHDLCLPLNWLQYFFCLFHFSTGTRYDRVYSSILTSRGPLRLQESSQRNASKACGEADEGVPCISITARGRIVAWGEGRK